jgi:signal transduction histidine kinase
MSEPQAHTVHFPAILASSVHDMKNSLSNLRALINQLEYLYPESKPPEFKHLEFESNRLNNSLMQLLTLYKIDASQFNVNIDECCVMDILADIVAQQSSLLALSDIELIAECDDDLFCFCDSTLISNAISTLVNNAQRYCKSKILLSAQQEGEYVAFYIEDDGIGYPENFLADTQYNTSIDLASGNTGLGLYFVAIIAKMHNKGESIGFIKTDNASSLGGARFSLYLP